MKNFLHFFVTTFGFNDTSDFLSSIVNLKLLLFSIPAAIIWASTICLYFGFTPLVFISFGILALLEILTGVFAAKKLEIIQKNKFSRFGLKIFVYMCLFFVTNSFSESYNTYGFYNQLLYMTFYSIHVTLVSFVSIEYLISIIENISIITGGKNNKMLSFLKHKRDKIFDIAKDNTDLDKKDEIV